MNTLKNLTAVAVLGVVALGSTGCVRAETAAAGFSEVQSITLGVGRATAGVGLVGIEIGKLTAAIGKTIALEVSGYLREALQAPRVAHVRHAPSVSVEQIETVLVVATRLPAGEQLQNDALVRTAQLDSSVRL